MVNRNQNLYDKDTKKAKGVQIIDAETNKTYEYYAKIVFVNASALNSAWVLMNSATDVWEGGLGSSSGQLGHNVMDHHLGVGAGGRVEGYEDKYYFGRRANGFYIPRYRNLGRKTRLHPRFWLPGWRKPRRLEQGHCRNEHWWCV
jgi:choline dehydrogenase-like flavoprotein